MTVSIEVFIVASDPFSQAPKRPSEHALDKEGILAVETALTDPLFVVHTSERHDYGVDMVAEAFDDGNATNFRSHLQLKSRTKEANQDGSVSVSVRVANLTVLLGQPLSAYILYHKPSERLFFKFALDAADAHRKQRNFDGEKFTVRFDVELTPTVVSDFHTKLLRHGEANRSARWTQEDSNGVVEQMESLAKSASSNSVLLSLLIREAQRHYERALDLESDDLLHRAIQSLQDAERLLRESNAEPELLLRVTSLCGGLQAVSGRVADSLATTERSIELLADGDLDQAKAHAIGNRALALLNAGQGQAALPMIHQVLAHTTATEDLPDTVLTLQHLVECLLENGDMGAAASVGGSLTEALHKYEILLGPGNTTKLFLAANGTLGNLYFALGRGTPASAELENALCVHRRVADVAKGAQLTRVQYIALASVGMVLWHQDDPTGAVGPLTEVVRDAPDDIAGVRATAAFNLALVLKELGEPADSLEMLLKARKEYLDLGDAACVADCDNAIQAVSNG